MNRLATIDGHDPRDDDIGYRQLPHNLEAEQALLGAVLVNNDCLDLVTFLEPRHFFEDVHGRIFDACQKSRNENRVVDPVKLQPYFENDPGLEDVGGAEYLVRIVASAATTISAKDYGQTIFDLSALRDLIAAGEELVLNSYEADYTTSPTEILERAEHALSNISRGDPGLEVEHSLAESVTAAAADADQARRSGGKLLGAAMGLPTLDNLTGGAQEDNLIYFGARTAMGKTALAINTSLAFARSEERPTWVGYCSLEMNHKQLANRFIANIIGRSVNADRRGNSDEASFREYLRGGDALRDMPIDINDRPGQTVSSIRAQARKWKRRFAKRGYQNGAVFVDTIGLMKSEDRHMSTVEATMKNSQGLKRISKELGIPVIALVQIGRQVEQRDNKRPMLSDLRWSGSIEEDADVVIFIYRPEEYLKKMKPDAGKDPSARNDWEAEMNAVEGLAEIILGKNRDGESGETITARCNMASSRFWEDIQS